MFHNSMASADVPNFSSRGISNIINKRNVHGFPSVQLNEDTYIYLLTSVGSLGRLLVLYSYLNEPYK